VHLDTPAPNLLRPTMQLAGILFARTDWHLSADLG
jgi:hypothetical protein